MYLGGMVGSTAGGIKQLRFCVILKQIYSQCFHLIHLKAVTAIKISDKTIESEIVASIFSFALLSLFVWIVASVILTFSGLDIITAFSTTISALSSVGSGLGKAGPLYTMLLFSL